MTLKLSTWSFITDMWRAASVPKSFFERLATTTDDLNVRRTAAVLSLSFIIGFLFLALAFIRLSESNAYGLILGAALLLGLVEGLFLWLLGSLIVQVSSKLDLRAWELVGWSWTPAFFTGLSLIPAALIAPGLTMILGLLTALVWQLVVLRAGLSVFAEAKVWRTLIVYVGVSYLLPAAISLFLVTALVPRGG